MLCTPCNSTVQHCSTASEPACPRARTRHRCLAGACRQLVGGGDLTGMVLLAHGAHERALGRSELAQRAQFVERGAWYVLAVAEHAHGEDEDGAVARRRPPHGVQRARVVAPRAGCRPAAVVAPLGAEPVGSHLEHRAVAHHRAAVAAVVAEVLAVVVAVAVVVAPRGAPLDVVARVGKPPRQRRACHDTAKERGAQVIVTPAPRVRHELGERKLGPIVKQQAARRHA
mmetsp:Transcript_42440/g.104383  ORF Transcript_42440/g.104383 Transcript_42440/m.104383 type:complete len:228 (-) Transcript_42440:190-873(-)